MARYTMGVQNRPSHKHQGNPAQVVMQRRFDIKADPIRRKSRSATCTWVCASGGEELRLFRSESQAAPRTFWQQLAPELVQIGQRKHGVCAGQVLGQTAVSDP